MCPTVNERALGPWMLRYRADVDGLRAMAIVPIVLYHAGVQTLRGGYTGVDVFFVISGFLITQVLLIDLTSERFSIARFYQRRVARIFPALLVVLVFVLIISPPVLRLPSDIAAADRSVVAAAGFMSNIFFWSHVSYFAHAADSQLLLHTWSLGVEEQFYIFYPLLMLALHRISLRRTAVVLAALGLISFGVGLLVHPRFPSSDFYLLPTRAWELLVGGLVALGALPKVRQCTSTILAVGGAGLVIAAMILLPTWLPFPTPFALAPVVGTALILGYGESTVVGNGLSWRPVRWIGQISYSLYLWHWPLITVYRQLTGDVLDTNETVLLVIVSVAAATVSYYVVERPSQRWLRSISPKNSILTGLAGMFAVATFGFGFATAAPRLWPISTEAARIAAFENYASSKHDDGGVRSPRCFVGSPNEQFNTQACLASAPGMRNVVLLGDSHADMYGTPLRQLFPQIHFLQATYFGCPPVVRGSRDWRCTAMIQQVIGPLASSGKIQGIILASRWRVDQAERLSETIRLLRAKNLSVLVIGPVTEYQGSFPTLLARAVQAGSQTTVRGFLAPVPPQVDALFGPIARAAGATYVSPYSVICPGGTCLLFAPDRTPMHFDYGHLTGPGAEFVIRALLPSLTAGMPVSTKSPPTRSKN
jgi:peptidoglycan/LPS O-acetylase OafA/YrhL